MKRDCQEIIFLEFSISQKHLDRFKIKCGMKLETLDGFNIFLISGMLALFHSIMIAMDHGYRINYSGRVKNWNLENLWICCTGTRRLSGISKFILGSVSSEIIKLSKIAVLIVPYSLEAWYIFIVSSNTGKNGKHKTSICEENSNKPCRDKSWHFQRGY